MFNIVKPYREFEINAKTKVSGRLKLKTITRDGNVKSTAEFENLALNGLLRDGVLRDNVLTNSGFVSGIYQYKIAVGTGVQTEPQVTETQLGNLLDKTFCNVRGVKEFPIVYDTTDLTTGYFSLFFDAEFDYNEAVGDITELGLEPYTSTQGLMTRALIRDDQGNPTTLSKSSNEKLVIEYEIRMSTLAPMLLTAPGLDAGSDVNFWVSPHVPRVGYNGLNNPESQDIRDPSYHYASVADTDEFRDPRNANVNYSYSYFDAIMSCNKVLGVDADQLYGISGNQFQFFNRVQPETSDRTTAGIKLSPRGAQGSPYTGASLIPTTSYLGALGQLNAVAVDASTGHMKPFVIPAGYRMDINWSFERTNA